MSKINIIHISDIHFEKNEPENQGLIINSFFKDLEENQLTLSKESTYCIITGDLVKAGSHDNIYESFYQNFIIRLTKFVHINNIYCLPGNHDLNRNIVESNIDIHNEVITKDYKESEFNDFLKTDDNILIKKFRPFENFCNKKLNLQHFNLYGYSENLIPEISFFILNSALCSSGGFNSINDEGKLKIETSELNKWISENSGRKRVLLMHHPFEHLTKFAQNELKSMFNRDINILINGHIHEQELVSNYNGFIKICSPQLFSDKSDLQGYSILTFDKADLVSIAYRQWVYKQRKFMAGRDFSGTDSGVITFSVENKVTSDDFITKRLVSEFNISMKSYSQTPDWIERILSSSPPNSSLLKDKGEKYDYLNIINNPKNYQIIAAPQFGLTCYSRYLSLKSWEINKNFWLYLNCEGWSISKAISDIDNALIDFEVDKQNVKCLLLDDWRNTMKDASKILAKIKSIFPDIPLIILSNFHDSIVIDGLDSEESHEGFKQLYLRELDRSGLRRIVNYINNVQHIAEENKVLERLNLDLVDLNIHRTPINCLQILIAFLNNFEDRPINRSKVFSYMLKVIFENPGNLFYGNNLDEYNCSFIMGNFCEYLLRNDKESFNEEEFLRVSIPFGEENYNPTNISDLLDVLKNTQIVVNHNGTLRFRFSYWIYFFAAGRMKISNDFADYMFDKKHSLYYPEIIEFYSGTDGAREDVAIKLISELEQLSKNVHCKIGLKEDLDPFTDIKWSLNETIKGMTQEQLETKVKNSRLPDEIKDVIADKNYDSIKPYHQTIHTFLEDYDVKNLMELTRSASRALRNSEFISPALKENLSKSIFNSWNEITRVLLLIAPILAKNGFGGVGGARFELAEDFPKEYSECLKRIVIAMPFNIMNWYKDDFFSDKLILLLDKYLIEYPDPKVRHIIALIITCGKPPKWQESIQMYIKSIGKNSYYLGDLYSTLSNNYSTKYMLPQEIKQTENLIKSCWAKHNTGSPSPGTDTIAKVPKNILPSRNPKDLE